MPGLDLLLRLLIAHVLGDFLLQPRSWVRERTEKHHRSTALYLHGMLHGLLALLALGDLSRWPSACPCSPKVPKGWTAPAFVPAGKPLRAAT